MCQMIQKGLQQQVVFVCQLHGTQRENWISRDKFNFTLAHFFILRSGHVHRSSDEPADFSDVPDGRLSIVTTDNSSVTGFTFE